MVILEGGDLVRVAIIGSRSCKNFDTARIKKRLPDGCVRIISGGAAGVDTAAEKLADELGIEFVRYEPDYTRYGSKAPLVRNIKIIENADYVMAFWDLKSRGTAHALAACVKRQIPFQIFELDE